MVRYYQRMTVQAFMPILIAGIVSVLLGWIWSKIFGSTTRDALTPELIEQNKKRKPLMVFFAFLASMLVAYVMSYFGAAWGVYDWIGALELGFWCWVGFALPTMRGAVLWEQKPFSVFLIKSLYWLVVFMAIALVLVFTSAPVQFID